MKNRTMALTPLSTKSVTSPTAFELLMRQAPRVANHNGTLALVRTAAKNVVVLGTEKTVLRGVFAWLGTTLANPALGAVAFVCDLFPGDTPIRDSQIQLPAIDKPPFGTSAPEWHTQMQEAAQLASEITNLQHQIRLLEEHGLGKWTWLLKQQLEGLITKAETIVHNTNSPITSGALKMVASAGGSDVATSPSQHVPRAMEHTADGALVLARQQELRNIAELLATHPFTLSGELVLPTVDDTWRAYRLIAEGLANGLAKRYSSQYSRLKASDILFGILHGVYNAVVHGNRFDVNKHIIIRWHIDGTEAVFQIQDEGVEPIGTNPGIAVLNGGEVISGLGEAIGHMRSLFDEVDLRPIQDGDGKKAGGLLTLKRLL